MTLDNSVQIQLLSPDIIQQYPQEARTVDRLKKGLFKEIGWHYWVDLTWILASLRERNILPGATILDAGAGYGLLQFVLAYAGYNVISVDFTPRKPLSFHTPIFPMRELATSADFQHVYIDQVKEYKRGRRNPKRLMAYFATNWDSGFHYLSLLGERKLMGRKPGELTLYRADIKDMSEIRSAAVDAVVSCSVIEHLKMEDVSLALKEFSRVLKPGKPMLITTSAAKEADWYYEPVLGWCFTRQTLSKIFGNTVDPECGYENFDGLLQQYRESKALIKRMPSASYITGSTGMPWGVWDPKYIPVAIVKRNE